MLDRYLDTSGQLDYQKLWSDMGAIQGFLKDKRREALHKEVVDAYNSKEQLDNTPTRYLPATDTVQVGLTETKMVDRGHIFTEMEVVESVNKRSNRNFRLTDYEFCTFDAQDDDYIVEVKVRKKRYPDCLIEYDKYQANIRESERSGREFLYIVATSSDILVFNIDKLRKKDYKFRWDWKVLPKNTDFGGDEQMITKFVGFIDITEASVHYKD